MELFGKYPLRLSLLRRALSLFAVLVALLQTAVPALASSDEVLTASAQNDQSNSTGEDPEDVVPDPNPHLAPAGPGRHVPDANWHEHRVIPLPFPRTHFAHVDRTVPIDPSVTGMGVRLRC